MKMNSLIFGFALIVIAGCGIQLKTPPELGVKLNVDGKGLIENARTLMQKQIPPAYFRFLKEPKLKKYIMDIGAGVNAQCLMPMRSMVEFENQGGAYTFVLNQQCFVIDNTDPTAQSYQEIRFAVYDSVDAVTQKYQVQYDYEPELNIMPIAKEKVEKILTKARVLTP